MRVISNKSSGKMSLALARALFLRGAEVILIYGSISEALPYYLSEAIQTLSVNQMHETVLSHAMDCNWIIKCAAVSDYKPAAYSESKIKKGE
ncbi:MAG TPA: bifunctional 4'-phosphopantothenoylcysteine decarboxylase/phosphopantothenoylcysteine synthetase, partial [Candidatus Cloacimonas sp.]|nr:bifunctional 4'-phosphopantothenoylcysteine decarboxylase/phosphopantothenoylcysteine synthetase [Candidatus Cloacimonas sp.]